MFSKLYLHDLDMIVPGFPNTFYVLFSWANFVIKLLKKQN